MRLQGRAAQQLAPTMNSALEELLMNHRRNHQCKEGRRYSDKVKAFAFTLHFYSPKTYNYLRSVLTLPNPRTMRRWMESVDCQPGFLIDVLKSIQRSSKDKLFSLVVDSMSIRKRLIVNRGSSSIDGLVNLGCPFTHASEKKLASEALVFLLVPLLSRARYPIGYFLIDKVDATTQASLIKQCLVITAEHELNVLNVTCDGCPSNISSLQKLGANIPDTPYFKHPIKEYEVTKTVTILSVKITQYLKI